MPTRRIIIALAHQEYEKAAAETQRKMDARVAVLKRDSRAVDLDSWQKLCVGDPELCELLLDMECAKAWRDGVIQEGDIPSIEDDGSIRWTAPQFANQPKH